MWLTDNDWSAIVLTFKLAIIVTTLLLIISTPLAWWLERSRWRFKVVIEALVSLPIVLPPSVIGFYLLIAFGSQSGLGQLLQQSGLGPLAFSFTGLVIASMLYSLPFVVQPIQQAFAAINPHYFDVATTLRAGYIDRFFSIALPLAKQGLITGAVLGFAHTIGEFGVVLMIGGNIPDETRVVSVQIYDYVEALEYGHAYRLSAVTLAFSFLILLSLYLFQAKGKRQ